MEKARLKWLCRRGMKELDVVMERYLAGRYDTAPAEEQRAFVDLLAQEDPQIWSWIMAFEPAPVGQTEQIIEQLRRHR